MCEHCNVVAANWWATKIKTSNVLLRDDISTLTDFELKLSKRIKELLSYKPSLDISTFNKDSSLLNGIAASTGMYLSILRGYEMRILWNNILIYDSNGVLEKSF